MTRENSLIHQANIEKTSYVRGNIRRPRKFNWFYFWLIFILLSLLFIYFEVKPKVEIDIWPNVFDSDYNLEVNVSTSTIPKVILNSSSSLGNFYIPGRVISERKDIFKEFKTSPRIINNRAKGIIRVYNKYSSSITLIKNTRFMSESGKVFLADNKITIPRKSYKDIKVTAAEAGKDYNIKSSFFSVPGLKSTSLYTSIYGRSFRPMSGGFVGQIFSVTQDDLDKAKNELVKEGIQEFKKDVSDRKNQGILAIDKSLSYKVDNFFPLAEVGQKIPSFKAKIEMELSILSFNKKDLKSVVVEYINSKIDPDQTIDMSSLNFPFSAENSNRINIIAHGRRYYKINYDLLKQNLTGQSLKDVSAIVLKLYPHLSLPPKVTLSPFWAVWEKKVPNSSNIIIKIHLSS